MKNPTTLAEWLDHPENITKEGRAARLRQSIWLRPLRNFLYTVFGHRTRMLVGGDVVTNLHLETCFCNEEGCCVHRPSNHRMRGWPQLWRSDRGIMERTCVHGIGHPDPDDINFILRTRGPIQANAEESHGCDGCCLLA